MKNGLQIVNKYSLEYNDVVEFKIQAFGMKMMIYNYKARSSTARQYTCPDHGWPASKDDLIIFYACL
jgi:hypothetical protein